MNDDRVPEGHYRVALADAKTRTSKNGHDMMVLTWEITDGPFEGRTTAQFINFWHPKEDVREIAFKEFAAICNGLDVAEVSNTDELLGREAEVSISYSGGYPVYVGWTREPQPTAPRAARSYQVASYPLAARFQRRP